MDRIIVRRRTTEPPKNLDDRISWLSDQLCLSSGRDVKNLATKILKIVLENSSKQKPLTSLEISEQLGVAPPRVNHHLRNLINSGILVRRSNRIYLRRKTLYGLINELRKDIDRVLTDVEEIAKDIDKELGLDKEGW